MASTSQVPTSMTDEFLQWVASGLKKSGSIILKCYFNVQQCNRITKCMFAEQGEQRSTRGSRKRPISQKYVDTSSSDDVSFQKQVNKYVLIKKDYKALIINVLLILILGCGSIKTIKDIN